MIAVLAGGVGAARFLRGLCAFADARDVTAIVNVADDFILHGLSISPDLDTVCYTLANEVGEMGWGRSQESWVALGELERLSAHAPAGSDATSWFRLGDRDIATHLYRSQRLSEGAPLSVVTREICTALNVGATLLPVSDSSIRTLITLGDGRIVDFQRYFVGMQHEPPIVAVAHNGVEQAVPASGVIDAISLAEQIVIAPSNPFVSIAPILRVPGVGEAVISRRHAVTAICPIVGGNAVKGPAADMLAHLGHERTVVGVAKLWSPYASTLVIDNADAHHADAVEAQGMRCIITPTLMTDLSRSVALAGAVVNGVQT